MRKIKLLLINLLLALVVFMPEVYASSEDIDYLNDAMKSITAKKILVEGPIFDYNQVLYELDSRLYRGEYADASIDYSLSQCDNTKCKIVLTKNDESVTFDNIIYYVAGLKTNVSYNMVLNLNDTLTIDAKVFDEDGTTQYTGASFLYHIDGLTFTNNTVKFTKPGIYNGYVESSSRDGESLIQYYSVIVDLQSYINTKLADIDSLKIDMSESGSTSSFFTKALLDKIFGDNFLGYSSASDCDENSCNANITITIDGHDEEYNIIKNDIEITKTGIYLNTFETADINVGEEYTPDYQSYSGNVTWTSSDTSIATIDANTGKVTAVAPGAVIIEASASDGKTNSIILRVKPTESYKTKIQNDFDTIMQGKTTIVLPAISSLVDDNYDYIYSLIYTELEKLAAAVDDNYYIGFTELGNNKFSIILGNNYTFNDGIYNYASYCSTGEYDSGFDCGVTPKEITIKYVDQVSDSGYDSSLVAPAKAILNQLKKRYVVNMDISFKDYLNHPEFIENYNFVSESKIGKTLDNPKDFEIGIDGRAGDCSFENASINGYPLVIKDGITYAVSINTITITRALVVNGKNSDSEETKIANIKSTISKTLDSEDEVIVKRNDDRSFNIVILSNSVSDVYQNLTSSNYSIKPLTSSFDNSVVLLKQVDKSMEFNTFINFKEVSSKPSAAKLSISKGDNNSLKLTWANVDGADKYYIYRSTKKTSGYKRIKEVTTNEYVNTGLSYGTTYYYKIIAVNKSGISKYSNIVYKKVIPNKVMNLTFSGSTNSAIKMNFDKVSTSGYEVYRSTNNKTWAKVTTITKNSILTYTNKKLSSNKNYYYKVRAYKIVSGRKVYGYFSDTVKMLTAPSIPKIVVSLNNYNALNVKVYESKAATKYSVYRSTDKTTGFTLLKELTTYGTFIEEELLTGTTYYYKVKACNEAGSCSYYSSAVGKKVTPKTPSFSVLAVSKKLNQVGISAVDGADGYEVYRSTSSSKNYKLVANVPTEVSLNPSNSGKSGVTYYYKVRSYKIVDDKKVYSAFSGYKKVKTK